jgi:hypothetical protein
MRSPMVLLVTEAIEKERSEALIVYEEAFGM